MGCQSHPRLVNHHGTKAAFVCLLKNQDALRHVEVVWVSKVERLGPRHIALHQGHDLPYLRRELMHGCAGSHQGIEEHLEYLVRVHAERVANGIQEFHLRGLEFHADCVGTILLFLKFAYHIGSKFNFSIRGFVCGMWSMISFVLLSSFEVLIMRTTTSAMSAFSPSFSSHHSVTGWVSTVSRS